MAKQNPALARRNRLNLRSFIANETVLSPDRARELMRHFADAVEADVPLDPEVLQYVAQAFRRFQRTDNRKNPGPAFSRAFGLLHPRRGNPGGPLSTTPLSDVSDAEIEEIPVRVEQAWIAEKARRKGMKKGQYPKETPKEAAIASIARDYGISEDSVRTICKQHRRREQQAEKALTEAIPENWGKYSPNS